MTETEKQKENRDDVLKAALTHPSCLIRFIAESEINEENWRERLKNMRIRGHEDAENPLVIMNYGIGCDFASPIVQEARGIIIDINAMDVVCWPFRKFGNWNESYADKIDWASARITEKIDGSIIKLYNYKEEWIWATNATISAEQAYVDGRKDISFADVVKRAENYKNIPFEKLDKECTYIFELVSPETQVVIRYEKTMLYHIGTRNNKTGKEFDTDIGIIKPKLYTGEECSLEYWKDVADNLNEELEHEGFVVVDKDFHRIKIKTPEYLIAHRDATRKIPDDEIIKMLIQNDEKRIEKVSVHLTNRVKLAYYKWQILELEMEVSRYIEYVRGYYEELNRDRKALAIAIKKDRFAKFGFEALNHPDKTAEELLLKTPVSTLLKLLKKYEA